MKLIFCPKCWDVVKLVEREIRKCSCGDIWGRAINIREVEVGADTVVLGLDNNVLKESYDSYTEHEQNIELECWIIDKVHERIIRIPKE